MVPEVRSAPSAPGPFLPPAGGAAPPAGEPPAAEWESSGRRYLRPRPVTLALTGLAGLSFVLWLVTRQKPQLAIAIAIVAAVLLDGIVARAALGPLELDVRAAGELVAGEPTAWILQVTGVRRPIVVGPTVTAHTHQVRVHSDAPGRIMLPALSRGLARSLLFDVTAVGPVGLFEAGRRYRVRLGHDLYVGPPPLLQMVTWPRPRAVRFGTSETAPVGDDLFRSVRPYTRGDSRRRVHWKATAHHRRLMISELDGTGLVALRIVVPLPPRGPLADLIAARAAGLAEQALSRGWLVHLVTIAPEIQRPEPSVPLGSPFGLPPRVPPPLPVPVHTADRLVTSRAAIRRELATACSGHPSVPSGPGLTCIVGADTVEWQ